MPYVTVDEIAALKGTLTNDEQAMATTLIPYVEAELRHRADAVGRDLDMMLSAEPDLGLVLKSVIADIVMREITNLEADDNMAVMSSQTTESAGGYSLTYTTPNAGGGLFIKRAELARLGLRRQKWGGLNVFGVGG